MQTLKTGAIIILLMTVVFSAYTSLTSPPERLSDEVTSALELDESSDFLAIDDGLPPSLADIGIEEGSVSGPNAAPRATGELDALASAAADLSGPPMPLGNNAEPSLGTPVPSELAASGPPAQSPGTEGGFSMAFSDQGTATPSSGTPARPVSASANSMTFPAGAATPTEGLPSSVPDQYPVTNQQFQMPDPNSLGTQASNASAGAAQWNGGSSDQAPVAQVAAIDRQPGVDPIAATGPAPGSTPALEASSREAQLRGLVNAIKAADRQYGEDRLKDALATLSLFYGTPDLTPSQRAEMLGRLDALAAEVIYSRRHLLESPHRVRQNETLMEIAEQYQIPWQLLANINGVRDPVTILPGTDLKVVRGPFRAEVDSQRNELTLFLGDLYAGRFEIGIGSEPAPSPGTYTVQDKQTARTFYEPSGAAIPAGSADNPYGNAWIDLGGQVCIHGSPHTQKPSTRGCISLGADSADDLYAILSQGSSIVIK